MQISSNHFLSFHDISQVVQGRDMFFRKLPPKMIVKKVRFVKLCMCLDCVCRVYSISSAGSYNIYSFSSGRMIAGVNAIMGPSGSGKTRQVSKLVTK